MHIFTFSYRAQLDLQLTVDQHVLTCSRQELTLAWAGQSYFNIGGLAVFGSAHIGVLILDESMLNCADLRYFNDILLYYKLFINKVSSDGCLQSAANGEKWHFCAGAQLNSYFENFKAILEQNVINNMWRSC